MSVSITDMGVYPGTWAICGLHNTHVSYPDIGVSVRILTWVSVRQTSMYKVGRCVQWCACWPSYKSSCCVLLLRVHG